MEKQAETYEKPVTDARDEDSNLAPIEDVISDIR